MNRVVDAVVDLPTEVMFPMMEQIAQVYNICVDWAIKNNCVNAKKAQVALYYKVREQFPTLKAQSVLITFMSAMGNLKTISKNEWDKAKQKESRRAKKKKEKKKKIPKPELSALRNRKDEQIRPRKKPHTGCFFSDRLSSFKKEKSPDRMKDESKSKRSKEESKPLCREESESHSVGESERKHPLKEESRKEESRKHPLKEESKDLMKEESNRRDLISLGLLSLSTLEGRITTIVMVPKFFAPVIESGCYKGVTIGWDKKNKRFFAKLCFEIPDVEPTKEEGVIGIDRGIYNFLALSDGTIMKSDALRQRHRKYLHNRKELQKKGTRSAKRRLREQQGHEQCFNANYNHIVSKKIAALPCETIVLEDLSGIRAGTTSRKNKKLNKWMSSWPFFQFESFLEYKAEQQGKRIFKVDPRYTSQTCSRCGVVCKSNRKKSKYVCKNCGLVIHADVNAAINIKKKYLSWVEKSNRRAGH